MSYELITQGLTLSVREKTYLNSLLKHNWYYPTASTNTEYKKGKNNEIKLKKKAELYGGNYNILFKRVEEFRLSRVIG